MVGDSLGKLNFYRYKETLKAVSDRVWPRQLATTQPENFMTGTLGWER